MTRVITALDASWESVLAAALDALPDINVTRRCVDVADLLSAGSSGLAEVAVVSPIRGVDRAAIDQLSAQGVRIVGAVRAGDDAAETQLRRLGVVTVIPHTCDAQRLIDALHPGNDSTWAEELGLAEPTGVGLPEGTAIGDTTGSDAPPPADDVPRPPGRIVAVWGPTGAPGRTTVAVNLAAELARAAIPSLIIDADTYGASVVQMLSLIDEAPGLAAAARAGEQGTLDVATLSRLSPSIGADFRVLSGIPSADRWAELRSGSVEQILSLSRSLATVVVVDCGFSIEDDEELSYDTVAPRRNAATLATLAAADQLLVVGAADPVGLQRLVRAVQAVGTIPSPPPQVVINRVRASTVGADPQTRIAEALARFAGLSDLTFIPDDPTALDAAMMSGSVLAEVAAESPARLAIRALAQTIVPTQLPGLARARPTRPGLARLWPRT